MAVLTMPRVQFDLMNAGHGAVMDTTTSTADTSDSRRRVSTDLRASGAFLAVVIGGNLLWRASDSGVISALAGR
jgi:hypothetical protein